MPKYQLKTNYKIEVEAENDQEAIKLYFEGLKKEQMIIVHELTEVTKQRNVYLTTISHSVFQDVYITAPFKYKLILDTLTSEQLKEFFDDNKDEFEHAMTKGWKENINELLELLIERTESTINDLWNKKN